MKSWFRQMILCYFYVNITLSVFAWLFTLAPQLNFTIQVAELLIGSLLISLSLATAITVYRSRWGNGIGNVISGYLIALPIPFIIRRMFFPILFRFLGLIYGLLLIYVVFYIIFVAYHHAKNRQTSAELNALIKKDSEKK
jgi:hypothetical protein